MRIMKIRAGTAIIAASRANPPEGVVERQYHFSEQAPMKGMKIFFTPGNALS